MPERKASARHRQRVEEMLHELPENAQRAIRESQDAEDEIRRTNQEGMDRQNAGSDTPTEQFPAYQAGAHRS